MNLLDVPLLAPDRFNPAAADIRRLQAEFGLSYHVPYCIEADTRLGFAGKRVLEVGGSLPVGFVRDHLRVAHWTAVEELGYWRTLEHLEHLSDSPLQHRADAKLAAAVPATLTGGYSLLDGAIEDAPEALAGQFDAAFSIACFEHISRLPKALERIHRVLKPGGKLFTMFSPIWSAHDGHHLPKITDTTGRTHKFDHSPIPPWGHLLTSPAGLYHYLRQQIDDRAAEEMVYYVYHAPHINRLYLEDYISYFEQSAFQVVESRATFPRSIEPRMQAELERLHPGRSRFQFNGLLAVLQKPL
jgi:SAM-dependent methyltransferase